MKTTLTYILLLVPALPLLPGTAIAAAEVPAQLSISLSPAAANGPLTMPVGPGGFDYSRFVDSLVIPDNLPTGLSHAAGPVRATVPSDPLYDQQWHLGNTTDQADINAQAAWANGYTGQGVTIGIVDDGLQLNHPDLDVDPAKSRDLSRKVDNPSPWYDNFNYASSSEQQVTTYYGDNHGTSVAGAAAAIADNDTGISGAAPGATLAGLRIDFYFYVPAEAAAATTWLSTGESPPIKVKNHSYSFPTLFTPTDIEREAVELSSASGTIHLFVAGNEAHDANKQMLDASPETIVVSAIGDDGLRVPYSNFGACVTVTAPSSGGPTPVVTTDRTNDSATGVLPPSSPIGSTPAEYQGYSQGDYTDIFGGTSFATPLVSGVAAMAVEAARRNRDGQLGTADDFELDSRALKHLLARTSVMIDPGNPAWGTNGAGIHFSPEYGFGLVDAGALTELASHVQGVTPLGGIGFPWEGDSLIPDDGQTAAWFPLTVSEEADFSGSGIEKQPLEEVTVNVTLETEDRGDITIFLVSPSGMESVLCYADPADTQSDMDWTFTSNAFWGEDPLGDWTLGFLDTETGNPTTITSYDINFWMGDLQTVPEPAAASLLLTALAALSLWRRGYRRRV